MVPCTVCGVRWLVVQAVDDGASLPSVVLLLPLVHLVDELQEGALGYGCIAVHGPAQELELLHHPVAVLRLGNTGRTVWSKQALSRLYSGQSEHRRSS